MIRFFDAIVLAHTKLRTHKVRTGIAIGVAGILFGLILSVIFVAQGIFDSIERFGKEGLSGRSIVTVMRFDPPTSAYDNLTNEKFVAEVEVEHAQMVALKTAAAKKYQVYYEPKEDDPSPITIDKETKKRVVDGERIGNPAVQKVIDVWREREAKPFDIKGFLAPYSSAKILQGNTRVQDDKGVTPTYMKDGKEPELNAEAADNQQYMNEVNAVSLVTVNQSMTDPFINKGDKFDGAKGEVPVILPFKAAEKLLKLKPLTGEATTQERYDRLQDVRSRVGEVTADFCYRNAASEQLLTTAVYQRNEKKRKAGSADYKAPNLEYAVPADDSCGAVAIAKDTRNAAEKRAMENRTAFEKEIGTYIGEPEQHKVTLRAVGISGDAPGAMNSFGVASLVQSLLGSWLSYDSWVVPAGLLGKVPESARPAVIFKDTKTETTNALPGRLSFMEEYTVEFGNVEEARALVKKSGGMFGGSNDLSDGKVSVMPIGSSSLVIDEVKGMFEKILLWALLIVGGVAVIILGSIIGRTVSEGRRESAIFRAIGARRADIGSIYGTYAFLLSVRVMLFALALGVILAVVVELWVGGEATIAAQYAYAAMETTKQFHFFGINSVFIPIVLVSILVFGMIASIIPVVASARRNPIRDMRDDT